MSSELSNRNKKKYYLLKSVSLVFTYVTWRNRSRPRHSIRCTEALTATLSSFFIALVYELCFNIWIYTPKTSFTRFILRSGHLNKISANKRRQNNGNYICSEVSGGNTQSKETKINIKCKYDDKTQTNFCLGLAK